MDLFRPYLGRFKAAFSCFGLYWSCFGLFQSHLGVYLGRFAPFDLFRGHIVFFGGPFQVILREFQAIVGLFQAGFFLPFWLFQGNFEAAWESFRSRFWAVSGHFLVVMGFYRLF